MNKTIWSYWDGPITEINEICLNSWKIHLSDWNIKILNESNIISYDITYKPNNYNKLTPTIKSDVIRLNLLYNYGGVWVDATVFFTESLDWIYKYSKYEILATRWKESHPENWFIVAYKPRSYIIKRWLDMFNNILNTKPMKNHPVYNSFSYTDYFICYRAWEYLKEIDNTFKKDIKNNTMIKKGFYFYNKWIPLTSHEKFAKFTKYERTKFSYFRFPLIYIYIITSIIFIFIISYTIINICNYKKK